MTAHVEPPDRLPSRRDFDARVLVGGFVVVAAIVASATFLIVRENAMRIERSAGATLSAIARAERGLLERALFERLQDGRLLAAHREVWTALGRGPGAPVFPSLAETVQQTRDAYRYKRVVLVDTTARPIFPVGAPLGDDLRVLLRKVMAARRAGPVPFRVDRFGEPEFGVGTPVFANGDSLRRVIGAALLMQSPDKVLLPQLVLLERGLLTTGSLIAQMDADSFTVVSATRRDTNFVALERRYAMGDTSRVVAKLARAGGDTVVRGVDYRGVPVLASGQLVTGTPWIVVCREDLATLRAEGRAFAIAAWSVAAVLILLVALGLRLMRLATVRRSERQQYALASRYLAATTTSLDGSMLLAPDGRLLDVNESLARLTGYPKVELLALTLTHLMQTVPAEEVQSWITELMSRQNAHFHSQWRRKDGTVIEVDISASHLPDADGGQLFCFVRDVTEQITTTRRLARLNTLYTFLNRVSEALFAAKSVQAAYEIVTRSALEDGRFRLCWIGVTDEPAGAVRPVAWAGSASAYVRELHITLDPALPSSQGPTGLCVRTARVIVANDFARDSRTEPWHALAEEHGLAASASLPVVVDGRVVAAVMFYASETHFFDNELLATLGEVSRLLGLVVQSVAAEERSREEAERRHLSEQRFRRLFESSPLPMFVLHEQTLLITRVNHAFTERFGYTLQDIPTYEIQQLRFYPDAETRTQLGNVFLDDIARTAETDAPVQSPDLRICCKDGSYRDAQAFLSRAGDELVLGFVDVTEQRAMQATLQKAEEIAKLGSFSHDFTTNEFRTSAGFLEVLGFSARIRDAHRDPNVPWLFNLFHPDDTAKMLAAFLHSKDVDETVRAAPDEGPQRHLRVRVHVEHDALGHPVRAVGSFQDVTDEVTARHELTRLRDHLQDVVDERTAELAKANATLQAADRRLKAMLAMSQKAATLDEPAILQLGVDEATRLTGSEVGFLHLVTEDQRRLEFGLWSAKAKEQCDVLYETDYDVHSAATWIAAVEQRTPVLVNRVDASHLASCPTGHVPLARFLVVPVLDGDRVCMLLAVGNKDGEYDHTDTQELELIGHDIWSVVQRRRADVALEKAYERVKASDDRFAFAMEASSEGVWEWDIVHGRFSYNDTYATMLGYAPHEMSKRLDEWVHYLHPDERALVIASLGAAMQTDTPYASEFRMRAKNGSYRWILSRGRVIERDEAGRPRRAVGTHTDLTARRQAEDELREAKEAADAANRAKSAFLATMSHEIRTPLNGVIAMAEILAHSELPPHDMDAVQTIQASARALMSVIDDILDFSKIEAGRLEIDVTDISLTQVVEEVCESLLPVAHSRGVNLFLFVEPDVPMRVRGDPTRLRQIFFNLLGNALKFSGGRADRLGRVELRVGFEDRAAGRFRCTVSDNGIGMTEDTLARLFTSFTQAEASTTRKFGGTGLGLAITKRIVDLLAGEISVTSTPGEGSTFRVTLPLPVVEEAPALVPHDLSGLRCVVVEYKHGLPASDLRTLLEYAGARVDIVPDAASAADAAERSDALCVVIHDLNGSRAAESGPIFGDARNVRHLALTRGRRRAERIKVPNLVTLDMEILRGRSLIRAVAVASGRASPEAFQEAESTDPTKYTPVASLAPPLTVADARAAGRLILVAEDDRTNQKVILQQLSLLGHVGEIASNGAEALAKWRADRRYALLLSDLHMPEMDGYALTRAIRAEEQAGERLPIVALTANALRGEAAHAASVGMDGYLTKPVPLAMLRALVNRYLAPDATKTPAGGIRAVEGRGDATRVQATTTPPRGEGIPMTDVPYVPGEVQLAVLANLIGDDPAVMREFVSEFQGSARQLAAAIHAAREAGDLTQVGAIAHRLKSSARAVGALHFGEICAQLERAGKDGNAKLVQETVGRFDPELERVDAALTKYLSDA